MKAKHWALHVAVVLSAPGVIPKWQKRSACRVGGSGGDLEEDAPVPEGKTQHQRRSARMASTRRTDGHICGTEFVWSAVWTTMKRKAGGRLGHSSILSLFLCRHPPPPRALFLLHHRRCRRRRSLPLLRHRVDEDSRYFCTLLVSARRHGKSERDYQPPARVVEIKMIYTHCGGPTMISVFSDFVSKEIQLTCFGLEPVAVWFWSRFCLWKLM